MAEVIKSWDAFELLAPPLAGALPVSGIKKGRPVSAGQLLACHPSPLKGDLHSPVNGLIEELNEREIIIRRDDEAVGEPPKALTVSSFSSGRLARSLKPLGLDLPLPGPGLRFIISTINSEPGLDFSTTLFLEHWETMQAGVEALRRLYPMAGIVWAVNAFERELPEGDLIVEVDSAYPFSLPALIKKKITGAIDAAAISVLSSRDLYFLGRVWRTGLPVGNMVLTLGVSSYFVPVGSRPVDLLNFANLAPGREDMVIKGGLVRGQCLARLDKGLDKDDAALHLIRARDGARSPKPCRHCRACSRACPVGIKVDLIARKDFAVWPSAAYKDIFAKCLACGACALACPADRPLLSLTRLQSERPRHAN